MSGGGQTTVDNTPKLLPEGREGYQEASAFVRGQLEAPSVYGGQRYVNPTALQRQSISQTGASFGAPSAAQGVGGAELAKTASGGYYQGGEFDRALQSEAAPIFRQFTTEVLPGIRDRFAASGGTSASRRGLVEGAAIGEFGEALGRGAFAPIYQGERERQLQAVGMMPELQQMEALRLAALNAAGTQERGFEQERIAAERAPFEEELAQREQAAQALTEMAGIGAGGMSSTMREIPGIFTGLQSAAGLAGTGMMMYYLPKIAAAAGGCWVALALYGDSSKFWSAWYWINYGWQGPVAQLARRLYRRFGQWASASEGARRVLRPLFEMAAARGWRDIQEYSRSHLLC